jgi:hypothetical protein
MGELEKKEKLQETVRAGWGNAKEKKERPKKNIKGIKRDGGKCEERHGRKREWHGRKKEWHGRKKERHGRKQEWHRRKKEWHGRKKE